MKTMTPPDVDAAILAALDFEHEVPCEWQFTTCAADPGPAEWVATTAPVPGCTCTKGHSTVWLVCDDCLKFVLRRSADPRCGVYCADPSAAAIRFADWLLSFRHINDEAGGPARG